MFKLGQFLLIFVHIVILLALYSTYYVIQNHIATSTIMLYFIIPFQTIMSLISYYRAAFTSAGPITIEKVPLNLKVKHPELLGNICKKCEKWKPPRAYHCKRCNKCVYKMDHHCEWINNCIGYNNQKYFILFLIYILSLICSVGYVHIIACLRWSLQIKKNLIATILTFTNRKACVLLILLMCGFFIIFISQMLYDQLEAIYDNQTVVESHKNRLGRPQSFLFSLQQNFGKRFITYLLPIKPIQDLNYVELTYNYHYIEQDNVQYLEDKLYDRSSLIYKEFLDFKIDQKIK